MAYLRNNIFLKLWRNVKYEYNHKMTNKDGEIISIEEDSEKKKI